MAVKYRVTFKCDCCGHVFKRTVRSLDAPDPPCPNLACTGPHFNRAGSHGEPERLPDPVDTLADKMDWEAGTAPAVGGSVIGKAVDETARIVMEDHGMTDLRDNVGRGESAAPRLPPKLQAAADNFFGGKGKRKGPLQGVNTARLARQAMAGAFRPGGAAAPDPVGLVHEAKLPMSVKIVAGDK